MPPFEKIRTFILYLFAFSLSFENWTTSFLGVLTVSKLLGLTYFALSIINYRNNFSINGFSKQLGYIVLSFFWIQLMTLIYGVAVNNVFINFTLIQVIVLYILIYNHVLRNPKIILWLLLFFSMGSVFTSILFSQDIGVAYFNGRLRIFGENPNAIGIRAAMSIVILGTIAIENFLKLGKIRYLLLLFIPQIIYLMIETGSRGSLFSLIIGVVFLTFFHKGSFIKRILVLLVVGFVLWQMYGNIIIDNIMYTRMMSFVDTNELGGREDIWKNAIRIFYKNPIFGIGESGYAAEIFEVYMEYKATHNVFLYVLVTGGLVGFTFFILFFKNIFFRALYFYKETKINFSIIMITILLFLMFKSGGFLGFKALWIVLAIISATADKRMLKYFKQFSR